MIALTPLFTVFIAHHLFISLGTIHLYQKSFISLGTIYLYQKSFISKVIYIKSHHWLYPFAPFIT